MSTRTSHSLLHLAICQALKSPSPRWTQGLLAASLICLAPPNFGAESGDVASSNSTSTLTTETADSEPISSTSPTQSIELIDVTNGIGGFVINGIDIDDNSGRSVSGAGDVNGDGLDDLIIGASDADPSDNDSAGESYVVFGKPETTMVNLSDVVIGQGGFVINGIDAGDKSGRSVSGAFDVNGDGFDDLIIGASGADPNGKEEAGESYVVFGKNNTAAVNLSDVINGMGGFVINGIDAEDWSGTSVSGAGDINGDGFDDLIIGAFGADPDGKKEAGESYVVFGKNNTAAVNLSDVINGMDGFVINGIDAGDKSGRSVSGAFDVNDDGFDDLIIGALYAAPDGKEEAGESYVVFGKNNTAAVNLSDVMSGIGGFVINGIDTADLSGYSVSGAFDVNGDGLNDLIIGAPWADTNSNKAGECYVVFGKNNTAPVNLSDIVKGQGGFVINGTDQHDESGRSISAGDVNGDGLSDVIIGTRGANATGKSYVVFGKKNTAPVNLSDIVKGQGGLVINGIGSRRTFGPLASNAGDVNGDGLDDLIIGAPWADSNGNFDFDKSYVVFSPFQPLPAAPTNLIATMASKTETPIELSWTDNSDNETHFIIGRSTTPGSDYTEIAVATKNQAGMNVSQTYSDTDLTCGTTYYYVVRSDIAPNNHSANTSQKVKITTPTCSTITTVNPTITTFNTNSQRVKLTATISNHGSTVDEGNVTFMVKQGATIIGSTVISDKVENGNASVNYALPANAAVGSYTIEIIYSGSKNGRFAGNNSTSTLMIEPTDSESMSSMPSTPGIELIDIVNGIGGFVIKGIDAGDKSGFSVSGAFDVNGDGLDDLIIGAFDADPNDKYLAGESYVVFGKPDTTMVNLSDIVKGQGGFVINGIDVRDNSGISVSGAGDINGDGFDDLIIGASGAYPDDKERAGESYVVFGKNNTTAVNLSEIANGVGGFVIYGIGTKDFSGRSVSGAFDVNGDGLDDLIIGSPYADPNNKYNAGESYVVFGKNNTTAVNLSEIANGVGGFVINNGINRGYNLGRSVSSAFDVNGDGLNDLIIGAEDIGDSYVIFGKNNTTGVNLNDVTSGIGGFIIHGIGDDGLVCSVSSGAGDVNGDGLNDLIIGDCWADPNGNNKAGESYVVFGKNNTAPVNLSDIVKGQGGFVINGIDPEDESGCSVSGAGDINGDGLSDLIIGARKADPNGNNEAGESYVIFGKNNTAPVNLSDIIKGQGGFVVNGIDVLDISGLSVSGAGDVNGDGLDDLIIGAHGADPYGKEGAGESYVVFSSYQPPPVPPTSLTAMAVSPTQIDLSWTDNSDNETHFVIGRSTTSGSDYTEISVITDNSANSTISQTYSDTDLSCGTPYYYVVRSHISPNNDSVDISEEISATTEACATTLTTSPATITWDTRLEQLNQEVTLTASVTSEAGSVNTGTVTFTVKQGDTIIGTPVTSETVSDGYAQVDYTLPANQHAGTYAIEAVYNEGKHFAISRSTATLTIEAVAEIAVKSHQVTIANGDISPTPQTQTDFGVIKLGKSITHTFILHNTGDKALNLTGTPKVSVTDTNFTITQQPTSPIAPQDSTPFEITFKPIEGGMAQGIIRIDNDDPDDNPYTFTLKGIVLNGFLEGVSNLHQQVITEALEIKLNASFSNIVLEGTFINHGLLSNLTIKPQGYLSGGTISGYIKNEGIMADFEFRGASIIGGTLAGKIINSSKIGGYFQNVHLAANTHITGGKLAGRIVGEASAPALLESLIIKSGSHLSDVIIGDNVELPDDVTLGQGVTFTNPKTRRRDFEKGELQLDCIANGLEINAQGQSLDSQACFISQIETADGVQFDSTTLTGIEAQSFLRIKTMITVAPAHVGKPADLLIMGIYQTSYFQHDYMRVKENWLVWDGELGNLQPAEFYRQLPENLEIQIFEGNLSTLSGEFTVFVGYRLEEGTIVYNGNQPTQINILP